MATAKKKQVRKPVPPSVFNLLSGSSNVIAVANEAMHKLRSFRKNQPTSLCTLNEIRRSGIPIAHFYLQYLLGLSYLPARCIIEIVGAEGIGKTTLALTLAGEAARNNVPVQYQETEKKPMMEEQIRRCLSTNRAEADAIVANAIGYVKPSEIRQSVAELEDWAMIMRGKSRTSKEAIVPKENPLMCIIDTWSKLMSPGQAAGYMEFGEFMTAEAKKDLKATGEGSNLEHAKLAAWWCRRLPYFLDEFNLLLMIVSHQNAKIDMGSKGGSFLPADTAKLYNKTKIGGLAFNQNAAIQLLLAPAQQAKDSEGNYIGRGIKARVDKNSFGPSNRVIEYELREKYPYDTDTYQEPVLRFDEGMAKWFADARILGTTADKKRYTCEALGAIGADAAELAKALHANPAMMARLAKDLNIRGYEDPVDDMLTPPPPPPPDALADPGLRS